MKPIYFPFTHICESVAAALAACFGQFAVYRPLAGGIPANMQAWIEQGVLDVRVPVKENDQELETAVKNYLNWADLHMMDMGKRTPSKKTQPGGIPFFDDLAPSQLVADIKARLPGGTCQTPPDAVMAARVFLYFAQEFDRQNQELAWDLINYHQKEADLIRQLKAEPDSLAAELQQNATQGPETFSDYMISHRLEAWSRLFLQDPDGFGLFVTHSPAVLASLQDRFSTITEAMRCDATPLGRQKAATGAPWQEGLMLNLERLARGQWPLPTAGDDQQIGFRAARQPITLTAFLAPGQTAPDFFSRCAGIQTPAADTMSRKHPYRNTVFVLIEV